MPAAWKRIVAFPTQAVISTANIGGDDREFTVSRLVIEPGSEPLQLVLTRYDANIWLVTGAVERVTYSVV